MVVVQAAYADQAGDMTLEGNRLYEQGNFNEAIEKYDQALVDAPDVPEPKFNKANSYYRLDDLGNAIDLYKQVATESKDMKLVARAKYNLGNSYFQQGSKQKDSDLNKALDDMKTAIESWRGVLDIEPDNEKAAKNIEVARLTIKDIIDQLNKQKQQQDPNQPQNQNQQKDPNQQQNQQQQNQQQGQKQDSAEKKDQQQEKSGADPNSRSTSGQDPNEQEKKQQQQQQEKSDQEKQQQMAVPDTTAREILDREQRQRKERQIVQRGGWQKVDKDW